MDEMIDDKALVIGRQPDMTLVQFGTSQLVTSNNQFDNVAEGSRRSKFTVSRGFLANQRNTIKLATKTNAVVKKCVSTKITHNDGKWNENEEILNMIAPAREWIDGRKHWRQMVSSVPATRSDVLELQKKLETLLKTKQAHKSGLCVTRQHIMSQVFDELIRHVTVNCAERGLLLIHVRDDLSQVLSHTERVYTSAIAYGIRKTLQSLKSQHELMRKIEKLQHQVKEEKKIYDETLPYYHRFQQQRKSTEEEDKEYYAELHKLVKKKNALKAIVEQSVGPRKSRNKSFAQDKPKLLARLATIENSEPTSITKKDRKSINIAQNVERKSINVTRNSVHSHHHDELEDVLEISIPVTLL